MSKTSFRSNLDRYKKFNAAANMHKLSKSEAAKIKSHLDAIIKLVEGIVKESELPGKWGVSQDCEWLVKLGE